MTGVAAHVPGLMRLTDAPLPAARVTLGGDFAGMLNPASETRASDASTVATAFNARGVLEGMAPFSARAGRETPDCIQMHEVDAGGARASTDDRPDKVAPGYVQAEEGSSVARVLHIHEDSHAPVVLDEPVSPSLSALSSTTPFLHSKGEPAISMGEATGVSGGNHGVGASIRAAAAALKPSAVSLSLNLEGGHASVIIRAQAPLAELEARLKLTLADFEFDLAALRFNGFEQTMTSSHLVGGKYGNR